jgi:hypothetical protein
LPEPSTTELSGQDGGVGVLVGDERRPQSHARGGVTADGLAHDSLTRQLRQLAGGLVAVGGGGDDPGAIRGRLRLDAVHRGLQQRALAGEGEELLGPYCPAPGPEPRPAAAGHHHRVQHA